MPGALPALRPRVRFVILLLLLVETADARCIDYLGRPCRLRASMLAGEYLRAPGLAELHATLLRVDLREDEDDATGWGLECVRLDLVDFAPDGNLPDFEVSGSGLAARYTLARAGWHASVGVYLTTVWNNAGRYVTPMAELHVGAVSVTWRSIGLYLGTSDRADVPGRSLARDFELDARATAGALAVRGRYRDADTGEHHVRDAFLALGVHLATRRGFYATLPAFAGIGIRRELARVTPNDDAVDALERRVVPARSPWQLLVWLELDLGVEHRGRL